MGHTPLSLLQGTVDLLVLRALQDGPAHGYSVSRWIRERTDSVLSMEDAALYQAQSRGRNRIVLNRPTGFSDGSLDTGER